MSWVKLDDRFARHPKVRAISDKALRLHLEALCYSAIYLTDGHVPASEVNGKRKLADELTKADLWEKAPGGWLIHDYLVYNPSREQVENERRTAAERMARVREKFGRTSEEVQLPRTRTPTRKTESLAAGAAPDPEPQTHAGGLNDMQRFLLDRLHTLPGWEPVTFGALNKLKAKYGSPVVTTALQHAWESKPKVNGSAYGLLATICESVAKEQGEVG